MADRSAPKHVRWCGRGTHLCDEATAAHAEALASELDGAAVITLAVTAGLGVLVRVCCGGGVRVVRSDGGHGVLVAVAWMTRKRWGRWERSVCQAACR